MQDLRLKPGIVGAQTRIDDITAWLTKAMSLAICRKMIITDYQLHNMPITTAEFHDAEMGSTVVFTLEAPEIVLPMLRKKRSSLRGELHSNPLFG
jgi:hypothetical protein